VVFRSRNFTSITEFVSVSGRGLDKTAGQLDAIIRSSVLFALLLDSALDVINLRGAALHNKEQDVDLNMNQHRANKAKHAKVATINYHDKPVNELGDRDFPLGTRGVCVLCVYI
jgi:hypothetical protein